MAPEHRGSARMLLSLAAAVALAVTGSTAVSASAQPKAKPACGR